LSSAHTPGLERKLRHLRNLLLRGTDSSFLLLHNHEVRILALGPLSFKAAMPSESKIICVLSFHKSLPIKATE
jgi:hypothetical protein